MRNLILLQDSSLALDQSQNSRIASTAYDASSGDLIVLFSSGELQFLSADEHNCILPSHDMSQLNSILDISDETWFNVSVIAEICSIVCISHLGHVCCIREDRSIQLEGDVESGIAAAAWSPDQCKLFLLTNNDTILCMTNGWEVLGEIPLESRQPNSPCSISWKGDGEQVSVSTVDAADGVARVRIYNNELELTATGRNVAEGVASTMKGILPCGLAFAPNGSLIAVAQTRVKGRPQVAFLERNGLRHGEFDIFVPPAAPGSEGWEVESLHWDLATLCLAVGLKSIGNKSTVPIGVVQIYYRGNYHWYLKQQWSEPKLRCHGFDGEAVNRLYLSQADDRGHSSILRVIETHWEVSCSSTRDCTVGVIDGANILLSPLGRAVVPPPMSKYNITLPAPIRYLSFWSCDGYRDGAEWGMVCLVGQGLALIYGDGAGKPVDQPFMVQLPHGQQFRAAVARQISNDGIMIAVLGSALVPECNSNADTLHCLLVDARHGNVQRQITVTGFSTPVHRINSWSEACPTVVAVATACGVLRLDLSHVLSEQRDVIDFSELQPCDADGVLPFSETCAQIAVIAGTVEDRQHTVAVGLSQKNRLYCNETLVVSGASSFCLNHALSMLMYITVGTQPSLNFVPFTALLQLDIASDSSEGVAGLLQGSLFNSTTPRPVERGSRLVASVFGEASVVVQLPRGNLEVFEPRQLVLMKSRLLMNEHRFFECLKILRRQRVDLNYLVDYNPPEFISNVPSLVRDCILANDPDLLALFISSLDTPDVSVTKYPPAGPGIAGEKVNIICAAVREALVCFLPSTVALNPTLCTLAKQAPPRLEEALQLIRTTCGGGGSGTSTNSLATSKVQAGIKYLAFLADGQALFDASVGMCDFDMARAVARQCQMDPKKYLHLLEGFEKIGRNEEDVVGIESGPVIGLVHNALMNVAVNRHLCRYEKEIEWVVKAVSYYLDAVKVTPNTAATVPGRLTRACIDICSVVTEQTLFTKALPMFLNLAQHEKAVQSVQIAGQMLSTTRCAYAVHCQRSPEMLPQAVAAYLSLSPPMAKEAIKVARTMGDWALALTIANRYDAQPARIAQEIIASYKASLDYSACAGAEILDSTLSESPYNSTAASSEDQAAMAAQLCLEYCDDVEGAVNILLLARHWSKAVHTALRHSRADLVDEIAQTARIAAAELAELVPIRAQRVVILVTALNALWSAPDRLQKVAEAEPTLQSELLKLKCNDDDEVLDDDKSDISMASGRTADSFISRASGMTVASTGSSTVSLLSTMSAASVASAASVSKQSTSSFSIEGLEHSLLSRGSVQPWDLDKNGKPRKETDRQQKRSQKKRIRGDPKDLLGVRLEGEQAAELWGCGQTRALAKAVGDLSSVLLLLGGSGDSGRTDLELACNLQAAMDTYCDTFTEHIPTQAPAYPAAWLQGRQMTAVCRFQSEVAEGIIEGKSYELTAAEGIALWRNSLRLMVLSQQQVDSN